MSDEMVGAFVWLCVRLVVGIWAIGFGVVVLVIGVGRVIEWRWPKRALPPLLTPILRIRVGSPLVDLVSPECVDDLDKLERSLSDGGVEIMDGHG